MYESPINQILGEMQVTYENECMKAVQSVGFDINKEELTRALAYDRNQYEKGYQSGINDLMIALCDHCMQQTNECYKPECPFCTDGCDIVNIAEKLMR